MRKYRENVGKHWYWSRNMSPTLIKFNTGIGKAKDVRMEYQVAESTQNKTVFLITPGNLLFILGIVLLPFCLLGLPLLISNSIRKKRMKNIMKEYINTTFSQKFNVSYIE